jgi:hypothetical protein
VLPLARAGKEVDESERRAAAEAELQDQARICGFRLAAREHRLFVGGERRPSAKMPREGASAAKTCENSAA